MKHRRAIISLRSFGTNLRRFVQKSNRYIKMSVDLTISSAFWILLAISISRFILSFNSSISFFLKGRTPFFHCICLFLAPLATATSHLTPLPSSPILKKSSWTASISKLSRNDKSLGTTTSQQGTSLSRRLGWDTTSYATDNFCLEGAHSLI